MFFSLFQIINPVINARIGNAADAADGGTAPSVMIQLLLRNIITTALGIGGIYFFINLLIAGYQYISAGGDKESVQKATAKIRNAIVGLIVLLSIYAIAWVVGTVFGVNLTEFNFPLLETGGAEPPGPPYP